MSPLCVFAKARVLLCCLMPCITHNKEARLWTEGPEALRDHSSGSGSPARDGKSQTLYLLPVIFSDPGLPGPAFPLKPSWTVGDLQAAMAQLLCPSSVTRVE